MEKDQSQKSGFLSQSWHMVPHMTYSKLLEFSKFWVQLNTPVMPTSLDFGKGKSWKVILQLQKDTQSMMQGNFHARNILVDQVLRSFYLSSLFHLLSSWVLLWLHLLIPQINIIIFIL